VCVCVCVRVRVYRALVTGLQPDTPALSQTRIRYTPHCVEHTLLVTLYAGPVVTPLTQTRTQSHSRAQPILHTRNLKPLVVERRKNAAGVQIKMAVLLHIVEFPPAIMFSSAGIPCFLSLPARHIFHVFPSLPARVS